MGVDIFQFALPGEFPPLKMILNGTLNGSIIQSIGQLIQSLKDGEPGEDFLADLGAPYSEEEIAVIRCAFETIQQQPHLLAACFGNGSRGHDHWAYLWEIGSEPQESNLAQSAIFGTQQVSESAIASQGASIRWSSPSQINEINQFLQRTHFDTVRERFVGFPENKSFYKRRTDDSLEWCIAEMAGILKLFSIAADNNFMVFSILD